MMLKRNAICALNVDKFEIVHVYDEQQKYFVSLMEVFHF